MVRGRRASSRRSAGRGHSSSSLTLARRRERRNTVSRGDAMNASTEMMNALRIHERGGPERLVYERAPRPFVGIGDVLLRVGGASLTPTELYWPSTWVDHAGRDRRPIIPAHEVSGVVV